MWKNAPSNYLVEELMDFNMVDRQDQMCGCRILQGEDDMFWGFFMGCRSLHGLGFFMGLDSWGFNWEYWVAGGWIFGMDLCRYKSIENLKFMPANALMFRKILQQKHLTIGYSSLNQVTIKT
ncbi:hypothetical protein Droror1_Dr00018327 [Drosera rotundifolia]